MLTFDGIEFRNLEEQVRRNKEDIKYILEEEGVLNQFGIKVIGQVTYSSDLPDPSTYKGEYGDAYAVGTKTPFQLYIFTRQFSGQTSPTWFNIGQFPMPGPQGIQGPVGPQGIQGPQGSTWTVGLSTPTTTNGFRQYDMYLNTSTGEVYQYNGSTWQNVGSIKGPQGIQGLVGPEGPQGIQGPVGPQGIQGPAGDPFTIVGTLDNTDQLPEPTESIREQAYLIEIDGLNHLFVIVGTTDLSWYDVGALEGIQGPVGPQGPQGEVGPANTLTIGTVTTLDTGVPATASITGTAPNQVLNLGLPRGLSGANGTVINVAGSEAHTLSFTSDPQTQINTISNNVNTNKQNISELQTSVAGKSSVYVNNSLNNVNFTSDPQTQLNNLNTTITNNYNALNSSINTNTQNIEDLQSLITTLENNAETIVEKGNNYIRYGSGIQICWGKVAPTTTQTIVTLPKPFVNTNYSVGATNNTIQNNQIRALATTDYSKTNFRAVGQWSQSSSGYTNGDVTFAWIAIGLWK